MRVGVVVLLDKEGRRGGAERLFDGLVGALNSAGANAEVVPVVGDESSFGAIQETYLECYDLDLSAFDGVVSTKAPTYVVRHPNHVCYLVHTMRVFYDMFEHAFPRPTESALKHQQVIRKLDTAAMSPARLRGLYCIGREVAERLALYNGLDARVLHPGTNLPLRPGPFGDYFLVPGRLHKWKRVGLILEAFTRTRLDCRLLICGTGEQEVELRAMASKDRRIEFMGAVSDFELIDLYAGCLAVVFAPVREDFGYVALEAFLSGKPLVTCKDSGEPVRLTQHGVTGLVCEPTAREIAKAMRLIASDRQAAEKMGRRALENVAGITWGSVASTLLDELFDNGGLSVQETDRGSMEERSCGA